MTVEGERDSARTRASDTIDFEGGKDDTRNVLLLRLDAEAGRLGLLLH